MLTCICAGLVAFVLRFGTDNLIPSPNYGALLVIGTLLTVIVFPMTGLYRSWRTRNPLAPAGRALVAWCLVFAALLIVLVLGKQAEHFSRLWLAAWFLAGALLLVLLRWLTYGLLKLLRQRGYNRRYVVIVGSGEHARELLRQVSNSLSSGFRVLAVFNDVEGVKDIWGHPLLPTAGLVDFVHQQVVDEIWLALPLEQSHRLRTILAQLSDSPANVRYIPDFRDLYLLNHGVSDVLGIPMIDLTSSPLQGNGMLVKVLEDRLLAAVILLLVSPLMLLIAIGVKFSSPGPIYYRQERVGWNGRGFKMLKFRSMPMDAEASTGAVWASKQDQRPTKFGSFLRRTSLDELPQFINVLMGDMSIVGPRPERPVFVQEFKKSVPHYMQKHLVKAGITGWAQVNGWRGNSDLQKRLEHDLYY
ncbi:MAG: undecaprenyl-phosphate glucose phosphotransferase, partial [Gammaproteobacteria bacterium]|nr:undecaprenyl-phosphate glucose phosphotransferase [Gammaproteobacteria bacterium]